MVSQAKVGWGGACAGALGTNSPCTAERSAAGDNARQRGSGFPREAGDQNEVAFHGKYMDWVPEVRGKGPAREYIGLHLGVPEIR